MLFRTHEGKLVEVTKYQFKNDKLYYEKLLEIQRPPSPKAGGGLKHHPFGYKERKQS